MAHVPSPATNVSVALCTYNSVQYIRTQLESILNQEFPASEIVVADDGSRDRTIQTVTEISRTHPRGDTIRILEQRRSGGVARNFARAISACTGDVIALADHDDVWLPNKISRMQEAKGAATLVFGDAAIIDGAGDRTGQTLFGAYRVAARELELVESGQALSVLLKRNIVTGATVIVDRGFAQSVMPVGTSWVHDEWLAILAAVVDSVAVIREPTMEYRVHGANAIGIPHRSAAAEFLYGLRAGSARYKTHRDRMLALLRTASGLGAPQENLQALREKLDFELSRLEYPAFPFARFGPIKAQSARGSYQRFTDSERRERWRDALQRP